AKDLFDGANSKTRRALSAASLLADQQDKCSGTYQQGSQNPTTSETTQCRLGLTSFDLAPFCAAPRPNQKRSLSMAVSAVIGAALWQYVCDYGELPARRAPNPQIRAEDTSLDGTTNGSARINSTPNVDAGINGATHWADSVAGMMRTTATIAPMIESLPSIIKPPMGAVAR